MLTKVSIGYKRFSPCMSPWSAQHNRVHDFFLNLQEIFNEIVEEKSQIGFCIRLLYIKGIAIRSVAGPAIE